MDSRTRGARRRRCEAFGCRESMRRVCSCQETRERDEQTRPAPLRSGLGGQSLRVALVATLLLFQILLFGLLAAQTTRHVVELCVGKGTGGGSDGNRARSTRSHASRALKWPREEARDVHHRNPTDTARVTDFRCFVNVRCHGARASVKKGSRRFVIASAPKSRPPPALTRSATRRLPRPAL